MEASIITRGSGVYVWDSEGRKLLDGVAGVCCVNMGYGRRELIDAATHQLDELPFYNNFFNSSVVPAIELAELLCEVMPPNFRHFFFTNSGSEATDTAYRLVLQYWRLLGRKEKQCIISTQNAQHGSTVFAAALGRTEETRRFLGLPVSNVRTIREADYLRDGQGLSPETFGIRAALWLEQEIVKIGAEKVGAFIAEPMQGQAGFIVPPSTYWPEIRRICSKHDVLLISDEVLCGFGRLGAWLGCDHFGFQPDLITFAKGVTSGYVPLGGVGVSDRVCALLMDRGAVFDHGFTSSGHPVACAVAVENIRVMQREQIVRRIAEKSGPHLRERLGELRQHPLVGAVQACGMTGSLLLVREKNAEVSYPEPKVAKICCDYCLDEGLIVRAAGCRILICPPLVIDLSQIDKMVGLIKNALDRTYEYLKKHDAY